LLANNIMKTKLITLLVLLGLSINAASGGEGSASVGYASDYFLRGSLVSGESVQSDVSYGADLGGFNAKLNAFTNQSSSADTYIFNGTLSRQIGDIVSANLGLEHTELVSGEAVLDIRLGAALNTALSPAFVLEKNLEEDLYTVEVSVSHELDLKVANLALSALYGSTDASSTLNVDYYILGASASREISDAAEVQLGVEHVNSDTIEGEEVFSLSLNLKF